MSKFSAKVIHEKFVVFLGLCVTGHMIYLLMGLSPTMELKELVPSIAMVAMGLPASTSFAVTT